MIEDAQQALRYAASRPEVDPTRIALVGYSMGSFHAILAAHKEADLALAGPTCGVHGVTVHRTVVEGRSVAGRRELRPSRSGPGIRLGRR